MELEINERIDDLQYQNLKIIQKVDGFCFGIDAVLLANFAKGMKHLDLVVDLCSGTGIVAVLLSGKTAAKKIIGVEIQEEYVSMARRSVLLNGIENRVEMIHQDLNHLQKEIKAGTVDCVTVNPPYKQRGSGIVNEADSLTIARHEVYCTLEDVIKESSRILKTNGNFYMVHRPERLVDIFCLMRQYKIEPKRVLMVHPSLGKAANIVLVEGTKNGGSFLKWDKPLYVYDEKGNYTEELYEFEK